MYLLRGFLLLVCACLTGTAPSQDKPQQPVKVLIETQLGNIVIEVDAVHAPVTAANFLRYVDAGHFDGGQFHRTVTMANQPTNDVRIEVVQASVNRERERDAFAPVALERTRDTGLSHKDGTVSMARSRPDSATSSFFICVGDQPSLDFAGKRNADGQGFAAFGRVVSGMDVVRKIHQSPEEKQTLTPPIRIIRVARVAGS